MTQLVGPEAGINAEATAHAPAVSVCAAVITLTKRADFLRSASARRQSTPSFLLQARHRSDSEAREGVRVGFTCSKKVGNAVARNRAKRRLRAVAHTLLATEGLEGWDYVLVGRPLATAARPFDLLLADLKRALAQIHTKP